MSTNAARLMAEKDPHEGQQQPGYTRSIEDVEELGPDPEREATVTAKVTKVTLVPSGLLGVDYTIEISGPVHPGITGRLESLVGEYISFQLPESPADE